MMKRIAALLLVLVLMAPAVALGEKFKPKDITDARTRALAAFSTCAFSPDHENPAVQRWEDEIRVFAAGSPGKKDLSELDAFILELQLRVPNLPAARRAQSEEEANLVIHYRKAKELQEQMDLAANQHFTTRITRSRGVIVKAVIGIASNKLNQSQRNSAMRETLCMALGLMGWQTQYSDSILYRDKKGMSTAKKALSELDWLMLNFLYSPAISPAMTPDAAQTALRNHYGF